MTLSHSLMADSGRGFRGRCPHCGKGHLFGRYLKVVPACAACGEEFHHHRADDMPAYIVVLLIGHLLAIAATTVEVVYAPPYWVHLVLWLPLTVILCLGLLQPVKGVIVALQWHMRMHGFAKRA